MNLNTLLNYSVKSNPQKEFLIDAGNGKSITYGEFVLNIERYASFFRFNNINLNERVALKLKNSFEWLYSFFALLYIGAEPVLIDSAFTQRETDCCMENSGSNILIISDSERNLDISHTALKYKRVFVFSSSSYDNPKIVEINENAISNCGLTSIKKYSGNGFVVLFSYRGFGYPLAVLFNESSLIYGALDGLNHTGSSSSMIASVLLPFSHIFCLVANVVFTILCGGTLVIIKDSMPGEILGIFEEYKVNYMTAVPTLIKLFLHSMKKKNYNISSLRHGIIGGNSLDYELDEAWKSVTEGGILSEGYGLTETCPLICNKWDENKRDSIGISMGKSDFRIINKDKKDALLNEEGTLFVRSRTLFKGYININGEKCGLFKDGFFDTGDIVYKDSDNYYYFVRRDKNIAKISGETVDLKEVENVIGSLITDLSFSLTVEKDDLFQEKIVCNIKKGCGISKYELRDYLRKYLAGYKIPKDIIEV